MFIAYQNIEIDGVQAEMASFVADTREYFQPPQFGLRSDYEDLFAYEAAKKELEARLAAAKAEQNTARVNQLEAEIAELVKPDKVLPFVLLDRIVKHEGRAELVNGVILFDTDIDVAKMKALKEQYTAQVQAMLDDAAKALGYDSCLSVCSYIDTGVAKFDKEGVQFRRWRSAIWARGYELLDEVKAGTRAVPTPEELPDLLPKLEEFAEQVETEDEA